MLTRVDYRHTSILHARGERILCMMRVPPILSLDFQRVRQSILMDGSAYLQIDFTPSKDNYSSCNTDIRAVLTHVYASFIHCQACTAVRDCVAAFFPSEILCPEPNAPRNGDFEYRTSPATPRVGSRVRYSCSNVLYRLVGDSTVTCLATGEWSARTPTCRLTFSWGFG